MPYYKIHLVGGVASFAFMQFLLSCISFAAQSPAELSLNVLLALVGSLFPDIDTFSIIQKILIWGIFAATVMIFVYQAWWLLLVVGVVMLWLFFVKHRATTHTKKFVILVPLCVLLFMLFKYPVYATEAFRGYIFFVTGALSHLALDYNSKRK